MHEFEFIIELRGLEEAPVWLGKFVSITCLSQLSAQHRPVAASALA